MDTSMKYDVMALQLGIHGIHTAELKSGTGTNLQLGISWVKLRFLSNHWKKQDERQQGRKWTATAAP